jgi:hypothetical protein
VLLAHVLLAHAANAQWITLRTEGVPRTKDGKLNAAAPVPRAGGKPDFSGMWWAGDEQRPCPESIGGPRDCAEKGLGDNDPRGAGLTIYTVNIASSMPGGLPYTAWGAETVRERGARAGIDDPHVRCLPSNIPRLYTLPHLQRIVHTPKLLVMLNEYNASYRQIHMDGRALPVDPVPAWNGYSTARWDKDTLVVETTGLRDDLWLDMRGNPLTSAAKVTERIRRPNFGTLEIELTVNDPKAYTKPWTVTVRDFLVVDTELLEEMCMEGEKSYQHMQNLPTSKP